MIGTSGICFDHYEAMSTQVAHRDERTVWTLADALDALDGGLRRFVAWPNDHCPRVIALWIAHTHLIAALETTPRLAVLSPVKGSGKTRVLELLEVSCAGPMFAVNLSPSASVPPTRQGRRHAAARRGRHPPRQLIGQDL